MELHGRQLSKTPYSKNRTGAPQILETGSETLFLTCTRLLAINLVVPPRKNKKVLFGLPTIRRLVLFEAVDGPNLVRVYFGAALRVFLKAQHVRRTKAAQMRRRIRPSRNHLPLSS